MLHYAQQMLGYTGVSTASAHRYLRIRITDNHNNSGAYAITQLTCHTTVGGADVLAGSGATITATSTNGSNPLSNLTDGNSATWWASSGIGTQDIIIDWGAGAGKDICEIGVFGRNDGTYHQSPMTGSVAYSADNLTYTADWSWPMLALAITNTTPTLTLQKIRRTSLFPATSPNHRLWGIRCNTLQSGTLPELGKIEMRATVGGASMFTGGTPLSATPFNSANIPSIVFAGTGDFAMTSASPLHGLMLYDFGQGNEQPKGAQLAIKASSNPSRAPTDFDLVYQDGLGGALTVQQNFTTPGTWTSGLVRTFTVT